MKFTIYDLRFTLAALAALAVVVLAGVAALAAPRARQEARPSPRIDVSLHCSNAANADKLLKDLDRELKKAAKKGDRRNLDLLLVTNGGGSFTLQGVAFLSDTNEADAFIATIQGLAKPAQTSGAVTIHHCPVDSDADYRDWSGCRDDARASYREVKFP